MNKSTHKIKCRFCDSSLNRTFVDLGMSPIANAYIKKEDENKMELFYPLKVYICDKCFLVQIPTSVSREIIFNDKYAYFSSYSDSWLQHAKNYTKHAIKTFGLNSASNIVEIASNDGYLLQYFKEMSIPVLGIEPSGNTAEVAQKKGIPTIVEFFGIKTASNLVKSDKKADLIIANNVLAHVPDINDLVGGMKIILKQKGVITAEFPHLMNLINHNEFDTIYHEHYSYYSLIAIEKIFNHHGLEIYDVEEIPTHGGSLRIYVKHKNNSSFPRTDRLAGLKEKEIQSGYDNIEKYGGFEEKVKETKRKLLGFLIEAKRKGKSIVGYGAPAKGNTLLNYCGVRTDFIDYTVDRSPYKQNCLLPGTRIPIFHPDKIKETKPDFVLILPWNIKNEIMDKTLFIREWGGKFVIPIPEIIVY